MARRRAGVGSASSLPLAYDEVVHLIAQDMGRPASWVERKFSAGEMVRYLRMSEYHPHPARMAVAVLTASFTARPRARS